MTQAPIAVIAISLCLFALSAAFQIWLGVILLLLFVGLLIRNM